MNRLAKSNRIAGGTTPDRPSRIGRWSRYGIVVVAIAAVISGCTTKTATPTPTATGTAPASYPVTVGSVTLAARPDHIVSLSPTATEMLFAVGAGTQVVAVDDNSTYPSQAPKTKLSGYKPNAEAIAAYHPDLVVISDDMDKITSQLTALHIAVFQAPRAASLDGIYHQLADLGTLTGHNGEAAAVVNTMKTDITSITSSLPTRAKPLTYYYELDPTYYSVTSKSFVGTLFAGLGLANIADTAGAADKPYPQLSAEAIIKANPDIIFLADTKCCGQTGASVKARAGWATVTAVRNTQVVALDDDIASRWGPRVVDLLRAAAAAITAAPKA